MSRISVLRRGVRPVLEFQSSFGRYSMSSQESKKPGVVTRARTDVEGSSTKDPWDEFTRIQRTQKFLSKAELAQTVIQNATSGVLTVVSSKASTSGFPKASIVHYVAGDDGKPIFSLSSLSSHTSDLREDDRASLLAIDSSNLDLRSQQVVLTGRVTPVESEVELLRETYLRKRPGSFYVDFGDFSWFKMNDVLEVRYTVDLGANARFATFSGERYLEAKADPFAAQLSSVVDQIKEPKRVVEELLGFEVDSAKVVRLDALGLDVHCSKEGSSPFTCRVSFEKRAETLEEVEEQIRKLHEIDVSKI